MRGDQPLSTLAASLLAELARSGAVAERMQRDAYADLAAEVAVPVEVHEQRAAGAAEARLPQLDLRARRGQKDSFILDDATRSRLANELAGVVAEIDGAEVTIDDVLPYPDLDRRTLQAFVTAALKRDARRHYLQSQALLRDGLPHATITGGRLTAKVVLSAGENGQMVARFANEKNVAKTADAISELTLEFTVGAFPSQG